MYRLYAAVFVCLLLCTAARAQEPFAPPPTKEAERSDSLWYTVSGERHGPSYFERETFPEVVYSADASLRFNRYHTVDVMYTWMRRWAEAYPDLVELYQVATSFEGRPILQATLTNKATGPDTEKPAREGTRSPMAYQTIKTETRGRVGLITLHRPDALNALNAELVGELGEAVRAFDADENIGCIVVTGSEKAFAAGADIKEMKDKDYAQVHKEDFITGTWEALAKARTPTIAAVAGYALGGGCEVAMMCDIMIAADSAKFGQPGGTQRLTRAVGKAKAMELCLTGRMMDAEEAERSGLVAKVVPADQLLDEAMKTAEQIAGMSLPVAITCKAAVNAAFETTLAQGINFERRTFHATFALEDRAEGMAAFAEKRKPTWKHR